MESKATSDTGVKGRASKSVDSRSRSSRVWASCSNSPPQFVDDDGRLAMLLVGVVASVEEAAPVVGDYVSSDGSGLGQNEVTPGGLLHGVLGESPLHIELEELVEFAEFVEDELGGRRDLGKGIYGARIRESTVLVPLVSNPKGLTLR